MSDLWAYCITSWLAGFAGCLVIGIVVHVVRSVLKMFRGIISK